MANSSLFIHCTSSYITLLLVYVDGITLTGSSNSPFCESTASPRTKFSMKGLGIYVASFSRDPKVGTMIRRQNNALQNKRGYNKVKTQIEEQTGLPSHPKQSDYTYIIDFIFLTKAA